MSAALTLPYVWAESTNAEQPLLMAVNPTNAGQEPPSETANNPFDGIAFYRKRTELLLRRYMFVSMQTGRVPSLVSKEVFRGKASHYRLRSFEDAVIFLLDVEKGLKRLDPYERELISRIVLQEYTQEEAADMLRQSISTLKRRYVETLDKLSRIFLKLELLDEE